MPKMSTAGKRTDPYYQAQAILSIRDHAEAELRTKLARKGFAAREIDGVVDWLKEKELINDARFAVAFVANTLRFKKVGPRWLAAKLQQKGVAAEAIAAALREGYGTGEEQRLVKEAAATWRAGHPRIANDQQRLWRFLASRGFSPESIAAALHDAP